MKSLITRKRWEDLQDGKVPLLPFVPSFHRMVSGTLNTLVTNFLGMAAGIYTLLDPD